MSRAETLPIRRDDEGDFEPPHDAVVYGIDNVVSELGSVAASNIHDDNSEVPELEVDVNGLPVDIEGSILKEIDMTPGVESGDLDIQKLYSQQASRAKLLTRKDEVRLAKRIEKDDKHAREQMIQSNLRLVMKFANLYLDQGLDFLDLVSEGNIGLMTAIDKFDWRKGFKFSTYATWWIRQSMQRAVANNGRNIRRPVHKGDEIKKIERTKRELEKELGRVPSNEEVARKLGLYVNDIEELLYNDSLLRTSSLNETVGEIKETERGALIADTSQNTFDAVNANLKNQRLYVAIAQLPKDQQDVLILFHGLGYQKPHSKIEISRQKGISKGKVKVLLEKAENNLEDILTQTPHDEPRRENLEEAEEAIVELET